jgi:hypothetical protein
MPRRRTGADVTDFGPLGVFTGRGAMGSKGKSARFYRYRTKTLTGPWQPTIGAAIDDAIRAGQARVALNGEIHWIIAGEIERIPREE